MQTYTALSSDTVADGNGVDRWTFDGNRRPKPTSRRDMAQTANKYAKIYMQYFGNQHNE